MTPPRCALATAFALALPCAPIASQPLPTAAPGAVQHSAGSVAALAPPPRLLVIVSLDQCRSEYLQRFLPLLPEGGFRRLLAEGAVFPDAAHTHTVTSTAPGHAAIATGCLPARAGVPENEFLEDGARTYCVSDPEAQLVGSVPGLPDAHVSARPLERPTLGDLLQEQVGPEAIVCSVAWKDRTALILGGLRSDGSYWMDTRTGSWVTTDALRSSLPAWLADLNAQAQLAAAAGTMWLPTLEPDDALRCAGPDDAPGEGNPYGMGATFPHGLPDLAAPPAKDELRRLCGALAHTPAADDAVLAAARAALEHEALGRDDVPDLLCVGFAALDYAGHAWGPRSQEVLEVFLAVDRRLAELQALLDEHVGAGRWTLVLSSDHGLAELPEQSGALRLTHGELRAALEAELTARHGPPPAAGAASPRWILGVIRPCVWIDPASVAAAGLALPDVAGEVAQILAAQPGIEAARTRAQLLTDTEPDLRALAADVHPTRSGEVLFLCTSGAVLTRDVAGDHGTHHDYDRRVPLIFAGAGVQPGTHPGAAAPLDIVPTLARIAGLSDPGGIDGQLLAAAVR